MQTIEKALHQPMPFTTGGQTISDRLTAAKHSLAGSQLGKTICKATTEEVMAPKKKHLDYLLHCTNEPNVSIPSMANLLIERTQHPNWTVVYKALITIHNIMCYGNERFSQYLASCNTTFNLGTFLDKNSASGYDMSNHVRRYGKYIGEKIATYRVCAFDFCKVKRGREDGLLRTMHTDKLLKTLPILQNQIDALLDFQVTSSELNNGVINCSFILLFRDLIRLFACYNDGIINVLEKYFDMNKKQCRDALDTYKAFLTRLDRVAEFLRIAETVGIDRGEIPDLTRAPASLLEALEAHLIHLEGGRAPPPSQMSAAHQQVTNFSYAQQAVIGDAERQRYIDLENERLRQFEQKRQAQPVGSQNPFAGDVGGGNVITTQPDLLDLFQSSQAVSAADTNPFASFNAQPTYANMPAANPMASATPFGNVDMQQKPYYPTSSINGGQPFTYGMPQDVDSNLARLTNNMSINNPTGTTTSWSGAGMGGQPGMPPAASSAAAMNNPFAMAPQAGLYTAPMGHQQNYQQQPAMGYQQPMWSNPMPAYNQPFAYGQQSQMSYQQQQQQVQLVHQAAAAQQQAQAAQAAKDPFGA